MSSPENLGESPETIKRHEDIQLIIGAYAMRNETIIQLLIAKRVIDVDEKIPPSELTDILLHDVDKSLFSTIATVAREYFDSLSNEMRANLLVHGSIL